MIMQKSYLLSAGRLLKKGALKQHPVLHLRTVPILSIWLRIKILRKQSWGEPYLLCSNFLSSMEGSEGRAYLQTLLHNILRIRITDTRMFLGEFICTDPVRHSYVFTYWPTDRSQESNVILAQAYEYRNPSAEAVKAAARSPASSSNATVRADMTCRYLGLIVVPGKHIVKIEIEEPESDELWGLYVECCSDGAKPSHWQRFNHDLASCSSKWPKHNVLREPKKKWRYLGSATVRFSDRGRCQAMRS